MSRAYLGDTLDLHSGGEDNTFPHHECEIAQSESVTGKSFCNHWIHTRFLQVNGQKMSKSLGNFYTVRDLIERGADPLAIRYALISGVYNKPFNFTDQGLHDAMGNVDRLRRGYSVSEEAIARGREGEDTIGEALEGIYDEALDAMLDDLNTPIALAKALEGARLIAREGDSLSKSGGESGLKFMDRINALLGVARHDHSLGVDEQAKGPEVDEAWIAERIEERAAAKKAKDFARADEIRAQLDQMGIELRDTPVGTEWVLKSSF
jgi:cysteinyl-tRNA synthetase